MPSLVRVFLMDDRYRLLPLLALLICCLLPGISLLRHLSHVLGLVVFLLNDGYDDMVNSVLAWLERIKDALPSPRTARKSYSPPRPPTGYPRVYMLLSCVMWSMAFVSTYTGASWLGGVTPPEGLTRRIPATVPAAKPPESNTTTRACEILLAYEQAKSTIPLFHLRSAKKSRQQSRKAFWKPKVAFPLALPGVPLVTTSASLRQTLSKMLSDLEPALIGSLDSSHRVIADTGCSTTSSFDRLDFVGPILPLDKPVRMQGIGNTIEVVGHGTIRWTVVDDAGLPREILTTGLYVPEMKFRLFSPQQYLKEANSKCTEFSVKKDAACLIWGKQVFTIPYDPDSALPIFRAHHNVVQSAETLAANLSVTDALNQNLHKDSKILLKWHLRLGHLGFQSLQTLMSHGFLGDIPAAVWNRNAIPLCAACALGKAERRSTGSKIEHKRSNAGDQMKANVLFPGQLIATDQYETRVPGRVPGSYGSSPANTMYRGGTLYFDVATGRVWAYHQVSLSSNETLRSKLAFERNCFQDGVAVQAYHADNGIYNSAEWLREIDKKGQGQRLSGVGAHHQNGTAERAIKTVMTRARTIMLHALLHWPDERDEQLWPLAVDHSIYLWNNTQKECGQTPNELFSGNKGPETPLINSHVWGCPAYVLDPKLQDGAKLPKWEPRSRRGVFLGVSSDHSSTVGIIRNRTTGYISPQFHVVYDDFFETVAASADLEPPEWRTLWQSSRFLNDFDDDDRPQLHVDWLSDTDKLARKASDALCREGRTHNATHVPRREGRAPPFGNATAPPPDFASPPPVEPPSTAPDYGSPSPVGMPVPARDALPTPQRLDLESPATPQIADTTPVVTRRGRPVNLPSRYNNALTLTTALFGCLLAQFGAANAAASTESHAFISLHSRLLDPNTGHLDAIHPWSITNPMAFALKKGKDDPDNPTLRAAMHGPHADEFTQAMGIEIAALEKGDTWTPMLRSSVPRGTNVLPGTWALKIKRYPDGRVRKFKGRYCVRGDKQIKGVDYDETYAPVVAWTTVRMMLVMAATLGLKTTQIDFTNAFVQADCKEDVYIELPTGFNPSTTGDYILKLNKNLYGLCQAPKSWFDKLDAELKGLGFESSPNDPCMFTNPDMIILVYCDDCLLFGQDQAKMDDMIEQMREKFPGGITIEDSVYAFLGVELAQDAKTRKTTLSQSGLIKKILTTTKMNDSNAKRTPARSTTLGSDPFGDPCNEDWDYASVVGMLMYLSSNSRPDIQFAVHQCARFTYAPRKSHEEAVKHIIRYLQGTIEKGIAFDPQPSMELDCYVDADFAGLWKSEDDQDPVSVKSRTGYVLTLGGCPLLWVSRLQSEIALSTLEAEYIALSQAMRDLLPMRRIVKEVSASLGLPSDYAATMKSTVFEDNNGALGLASSPKLTPRTRHISVKYHFFKSHVIPGEIEIVKVDTKLQKADIFTKGLTTETFESIRLILMGW